MAAAAIQAVAADGHQAAAKATVVSEHGQLNTHLLTSI